MRSLQEIQLTNARAGLTRLRFHTALKWVLYDAVKFRAFRDAWKNGGGYIYLDGKVVMDALTETAYRPTSHDLIADDWNVVEAEMEGE